MFGFGLGEIILIMIVAIIALGPDKLPTLIVDLAKIFKKLKSEINSAKESIDAELKLSSLQQDAKQYSETLNDSVKEMSAKMLDFNDVKKEVAEIKELTEGDVTRTEVKFPKKEKIAEEKVENV
jgi:sec-independent protein translocase protein TatB